MKLWMTSSPIILLEYLVGDTEVKGPAASSSLETVPDGASTPLECEIRGLAVVL
jgi:hypothetical protein